MNVNPADQNQDATLAKLTELLRAASVNMAPQPPAPFGSPPMAFNSPPAFGATIQPTGLLVAVNIPTPEGQVSGYLQLPQSALANPGAAIAQLQAAGWPLRTYQRRDAGGNGYGNGGSFGGGYQQRGGRAWGRKW